jgi:hypothetical protein
MRNENAHVIETLQLQIYIQMLPPSVHSLTEDLIVAFINRASLFSKSFRVIRHQWEIQFRNSTQFLPKSPQLRPIISLFKKLYGTCYQYRLRSWTERNQLMTQRPMFTAVQPTVNIARIVRFRTFTKQHAAKVRL